MRMLYYAYEYYSDHGGCTHAREFFEAFRKLPGIVKAEVFPGGEEPGDPANSTGSYSHRLAAFPPAWRQLVRICKPQTGRRRLLRKVIGEGGFDALVMRTGWSLSQAHTFKKEYPALVLCLEINAAIFDESFPKIPFRRIWQAVEVSEYKWADCITVVSNYLKDYLCRRGLPPDRVLVNPNGVNPQLFSRRKDLDTERLRAEFNIPPRSFVLGYVGGMEPFRRLPEVVDSFIDLRKRRHKDLFLFVLGDGADMPRVRQRVRENHHTVDGSISCPGRQRYERIPQIMQTFDLAVYPFSNPYGSPQKLFEYLAMGLPTIGPDVPAVREVFTDGKHLRLASQDGTNLPSLILEMRDDVRRRKQLADAGRRHVLSHYTWHHNALRVFRRLHNAFGRSVLPDVAALKESISP